MEKKEIRLLKAEEIECRVGQQDKGKKWVTLLLYKDARVDYKLLDEVFGTMGWQDEYESIDGKMYCTISLWDDERKHWVAKQNVGTESNMEAVKGEASDALKRAGFAVGIGRELYTAPKIFIRTGEGEYTGNTLRTRFNVREIGYDEERNINRLVIVDSKGSERYVLGRSAQEEPKPVASDRLTEALEALGKAKNIEEVKKLYSETFIDLRRDGNDDTDPVHMEWYQAVSQLCNSMKGGQK